MYCTSAVGIHTGIKHNGGDCREKDGMGRKGDMRATVACVITFVLLVLFLHAIFWLLAMLWRGYHALLLIARHLLCINRRGNAI